MVVIILIFKCLQLLYWRFLVVLGKLYSLNTVNYGFC